jgi:hypothetical protein
MHVDAPIGSGLMLSRVANRFYVAQLERSQDSGRHARLVRVRLEKGRAILVPPFQCFLQDFGHSRPHRQGRSLMGFELRSIPFRETSESAHSNGSECLIA